MKGNARSTMAVLIVFAFSVPALLAQSVVSPGTQATNSQASRQMPPVKALLVDPGPVGLSTTTALFAHVAVGGGWNTVFTFVNTGSSAIAGNLILTANDGTPMNVALADPAVGPQVGSVGGIVEAVAG